MRGLHRQNLAPPAPAPIARRSSFYLAMRILPPEQRRAMYEIYAFCRAVDDIADDGGPRSERVAMLDRWRADLGNLYAGRGPTELRRGSPPRCAPSVCGRRICLPSSKAWKWTSFATSVPPTGMHLTFIATGLPRRSAGFQ